MPAANKESQVPGNDNEIDVLNSGEDNALVVEVKDDTPPEDRGRKPLEHDPLKDEDDEAANYTKGVQKRIKELTHKAHDERRAREKAEREREEAIQFGRTAYNRAKQLESQLTHGEAAFAGTTTEKEELAVSTAKEAYRKAFEAGDPDAIATATANIAAAAQRLENAKSWSTQAQNKVKQSALQKPEADVDSTATDVNTQHSAQADEPDESAKEWASQNPWFGKNRKMTSYVYGLHEELVHEQGLHPSEDAEEYYAAIDKEMRERFPDYEWDDDDDTGGEKPASKSKAPAAKPKATSVVAPVTRTSTGNGKKVTLSASEVRIAESFGLTPEQYAREKLKLSAGA